MVFSSMLFLWIFLPLVLAAYYISPGKIVINLHHVKNCAQPQSLPGYRVWTIFKNFIHHTGKGIGKKNLFPKSPAKTHYPSCKFSDSLFSSCNLSCNVAIFYNRSCDQLWKKGNIQKHMRYPGRLCGWAQFFT